MGADNRDDQEQEEPDHPDREPPQPEPGNPPEPSGEPPPSPFAPGTIRFYRGIDDELLAVVLQGGMVGSRRIGLGIAGPFLFRLNEFVHAVAAAITGKAAGTRGALPDVPGAGLLALAEVEWGRSVVFHFGLGPGEELRLGYASTTQESVSVIADIIDAVSREADEDIYRVTRELGQRVGSNLLNLINVLHQHRVDSTWLTTHRDTPFQLTVPHLVRAKVALEREEPPQTLEEEVDGLLYRADSKEHQFILEPLNRKEHKIVGSYGPELREEIRDAWDKVVRVRLRTTHHFLARQMEAWRVEVELMAIVEVLEE